MAFSHGMSSTTKGSIILSLLDISISSLSESVRSYTHTHIPSYQRGFRCPAGKYNGSPQRGSKPVTKRNMQDPPTVYLGEVIKNILDFQRGTFFTIPTSPFSVVADACPAGGWGIYWKNLYVTAYTFGRWDKAFCCSGMMLHAVKQRVGFDCTDTEIGGFVIVIYASYKESNIPCKRYIWCFL